MPNHVYNKLTVKGPAHEIERFKNRAAKFAVDHHAEEDDAPILSFWNFIRPTQEAIDSGRYHASHGWADGKRSGDTPDNWYNWNRNFWGTKWDAYDVELKVKSSIKLEYKFTTAWNVATPAIEHMVRQFPELNFTLAYKEECGSFDGTMVGEQGVLLDA